MGNDNGRHRVLAAACLLALALLVGCIEAPEGAQRGQAVRYAVYLPIVHSGASYAPTALVALLQAHPQQQRSAMTWHPALAEAARRHAAQLAADGNWSHCDLSGKCANDYATEAGCNHGYGDGNNVESLVAGTDDPAVALRALLGSEKHADHLLGRSAFFREQRHVGVALVSVPGSRFTHYWSVMTATCE